MAQESSKPTAILTDTAGTPVTVKREDSIRRLEVYDRDGEKDQSDSLELLIEIRDLLWAILEGIHR